MSNARRWSALCAAVLLLISHLGSAQAPADPPVVISQLYGGGGGAGALFPDYIELYNRSAAPVSLAGWSLQYASATGTGQLGAPNQITLLPDVMLPPDSYFLVRESGAGPLPTPFYQAGTPIAMAAGAGKVALARINASLGCNGGSTPCSPDQLANIVDLVGYGNANFFEGTAAAPAASVDLAVFRLDGGRVDTNDNGADFVTGTPTPRNTGNLVALSINDVTVAEGDASNPVATFTVSLNNPALVPVTFTIETVDETATAGFDYVARPAEIITIGVGERTATFDVTVLADLTPEPDETFAVVLTNVVGVAVADARGIGTIQNDDLAFHAIHDLQGAGAASPHVGTRVATRGIVTGLKSNGFFLQTPEGLVDDSAETSEGIFVFTGSAPAVSPGDEAHVTGQVVEFRRASDVRPGTLTEIGEVVQATILSSGNALPAAVNAAVFDVSAANRSAELERYEGMLVRAASLTVVAPTNGFGEFYGVIAGTSRPFREPGVDVEEPIPADAPSPSTIPRFDGNLERIMVDSDEALSGPGGVRRVALQVATGAMVSPAFGPLDYAFDEYRISLDQGPAAVTPGMSVVPAPEASAGELTISSLNLLNFFPPNPANPAQVEAFNNRLAKASLTIRTVLRTPDILGLIEVGDIGGLRQLRDRLNTDAGTSYEAYLLESDDDTENDQDIGYLVNLARVGVTGEPFQVFRNATFELCGVTEVLFDRPPFVLEASFQGMPVTVILNHLRSLIDISASAPFRPAPCTETVGSRVREKRRLGAESLADLIETRQHENLVVLGDMNAFEFSDGYVDILGTLTGTPAPVEEVVEPSADRWDHTLFNLAMQVSPGQRYSYVFEGSAQVLDHMLVNQAMLDRLTRFTCARPNADFPAGRGADPTTPERLSDHDAPVGYFAAAANLTTTTDVPALVTAGRAFTYEARVSNAGPDTAQAVMMTSTLPPIAVFDAVLPPDGWTCAAAGGELRCQAASLGAGASASFLVSMSASCGLADGAALAARTTAASPTERGQSATDNASSDAGAISNPAPVIRDAAVDQASLPNDGAFHLVRVSYTIDDNCGALRTGLFVGMNEPMKGQGDSTRSADWIVLNEHEVLLRARDTGLAKEGRHYTISIISKDSARNVGSGEVDVSVAPRPH